MAEEALTLHASTDRVVRWVHLSDLFCPCEEDAEWELLTSAALDRLASVPEQLGPIDFILVSGDVARTGDPLEYERATALLDHARQCLARGREQPFVLAVPGPHDANERAYWTHSADLPRRLSGWSDWWRSMRRSHPPSVLIRDGLLPGDYAAELSFLEGDLRLGVLALTCPTECEADNCTPMGLAERIRSACGDAERWRARHHTALLLTHKSPVASKGFAEARLWPAASPLRPAIAHAAGYRRWPDDGRLVSLVDGCVAMQSMSFVGYSEDVAHGVSHPSTQGLVVAQVDGRVPSELLLWELHSEAEGGALHMDHPSHRHFIGLNTLPTRDEVDLNTLPTRDEVDLNTPPTRDEVDLNTPPTRDEVEVILWEMFPESIDIKSFVFTTLRDVYKKLPGSINRKEYTRLLLDAATHLRVMTALLQYLPDQALNALKRLRSAAHQT